MKRKSINFNFSFRFIKRSSQLIDYRTRYVKKFSQFYELTDGSLLEIRISDMAGQKKNDSDMHKTNYEKADSYIIVYDINDKSTFKSCNEFIEAIKLTNSKKNVNLMLIGNKIDIKNKRQVTGKEGLKFALKHKCQFFETSCVENKNISEAFETLIKMTKKDINSIDLNEYNKIKSEEKKRNYSCFIQ